MTVSDLVHAIKEIPGQLSSDLVIGLPIVLVAVLLLLWVGQRRGRSVRRAEGWEIRLAVDAAVEGDRYRGSISTAAINVVCDMHGIVDRRDRRIVRRRAAQRIVAAERKVAA